MTDPDPADPDPAPTLATSSLVHELRQPVFALRGRLQLLRADGGTLGPELLDELLGQIDHIESLLELYGQPVGAARTVMIDVRDAVGEALALTRPRAESADVEVDDVPPPEAWVVGPPAALRQVLVNLLDNAIYAVSPAQTRRIVVRVVMGEADVEIVVEDTGDGVPDEVRAKLFEPFVTTKPPGEGSGLGLFISQRRAEELGGRVTIEPSGSGGTRARVVLPRVSAPSAGTSAR